jgi:nitrate reductase NapE component
MVALDRDSPDQRSGILAAGKVNAALLKRVHELSHMVDMTRVVYVSNGLVVAVIVLGTFAASSAVARPSEFMRDTATSRRIPLLKAQITALQSQLSVCSAVLVVGVIQISVQYRWPAALAADKEMRQRMAELSTATALGAGTAFAILLVSLFGGAGFVLWRRVNHEIARYGEEHPGVNAAMRLGLDFSLRDFYYQIAKTLGPLFVAGITAVFNAKDSG